MKYLGTPFIYLLIASTLSFCSFVDDVNPEQSDVDILDTLDMSEAHEVLPGEFRRIDFQKSIFKPGDYNYITLRDVNDGFIIFEEGVQFKPSGTIWFRDTKNWFIEGNNCVLEGTAIGIKSMSKNVWVRNMKFIKGNYVGISAKTDYQYRSDVREVSEQEYLDFVFDYFIGENLIFEDMISEAIYIGTTQEKYHRITDVTLRNIIVNGSGREGIQLGHIDNLILDDFEITNPGRDTTLPHYQRNGMQLGDVSGIISNGVITNAYSYGIIIFTYGVTFKNVTINGNDRLPNIFIGKVESRTPNSPVTIAKNPIIFENCTFTSIPNDMPVIDNPYGEVDVIVKNCSKPDNVEWGNVIVQD